MFTLNVLPEAFDDLRDIYWHIARRAGGSDTAKAFTDRLFLKAQHLASLPLKVGTPRPDLRYGLRSIAVADYLILFHYSETTLDVVAFIEGHRDLPALVDDLP